MKLTIAQTIALQSLSLSLQLLSHECEINDEFGDLLSDQDWFRKSLDEITQSIPDVIEECEELGLDISLRGDEPMLLAFFLRENAFPETSSHDIQTWSDGSLTHNDDHLHEYWIISQDEELSETVKQHLGEPIQSYTSIGTTRNLYMVDR